MNIDVIIEEHYLVVAVKVGVHGHVDVAGVELHVDLLVDQSLALLLEVLSDAGSHGVRVVVDRMWKMAS